MKFTPSKAYLKHHAKPTAEQKVLVKKRLMLWLAEPLHPQLNDHPLRGQRSDYRSINIGGDLRLIYRQVAENEVLLADVGSHAQLYE